MTTSIYPRSNQAARIIAYFGGARELAKALQALNDEGYARDPSSIYRWTYPRSRGGHDGVIPGDMILAVKAAARLLGIVIPDHEWRP
jgi:amino-acid N-acetyltransferase